MPQFPAAGFLAHHDRGGSLSSSDNDEQQTATDRATAGNVANDLNPAPSVDAAIHSGPQEHQPYSRPPANGSAAVDGSFTTMKMAGAKPDGEDPIVEDHGGVHEKMRVRKERAAAKNKKNSGKFFRFHKRYGRQDADAPFLHGTIHVTIHEAEGLPGDPTLISILPSCVNNILVAGEKLVSGSNRPPEPYAVMTVGALRSAYTSVAPRTHDPKWQERFKVPVAGRVQRVQFSVKDTDVFGSPHLGTAALPGERVASGEKIEGWFKLKHKTGRPSNFGKARIRVSMQYVPVEKALGDMEGEDNWDLSYAFFQPRSGNRVTLYIDAHADPEKTPVVKLPGGHSYRQSSLWDDLYGAIKQAKHMVYITGWSVWVHNMLVRRQDGPMEEDEDHLELGTLLKRKAEEGVRVLILAWDDRTSVRIGNWHSDGMLDTHDEETKVFFQDSKVKVHLSMRGGEAEKNFLKHQASSTNFTHHQKIVLVDVADVDAPGPSGNSGSRQTDTEDRREQRAADGGGAADSGVRSSAGADAPGDATGAADTGVSHSAGNRTTVAASGASNQHQEQQLPAQRQGDRPQDGAAQARQGESAMGVGGQEMRENAAATTDDDPDHKQHKHYSAAGDGNGMLGSSMDAIGDTGPGTGHRAQHGAQTGPTQGQGKRRLVAFVGGIDVTTGRYDDRTHSLFRTLHTTHSKDYYSNCVPGSEQECGAPRQPWHDTHTRIEGPAAFDVLANFEHRWRHQTSTADAKDLLDLREAGPPDLALPRDLDQPQDEAVMVVDPADEQAWRTQIFRTIDSECSMGLCDAATDNAQAYDWGLVTARGTTVDRSIQNAYIHAIRKAERFIYLENQYFMGGSGEWDTFTKMKICPNLVPVEIALKVAEKIRAGEPFAAYIVVPLYSEGPPKSLSIQEVQKWQSKTMRMMYRIVGRAIRESGKPDAHPRDYLNFFFLGQREEKRPDEPVPAKQPKKNSPQGKVCASRRGFIYVHSKTLVIDDEYMIVGSANINQRSMDGSRDTEICMGSRQPNLQHPRRGQVHGFRMALWEEHLGQLEDVMEEPGQPECVRRIREMAKANWDVWTAKEVRELESHLCPFPIQVARDGALRALPGYARFPDVGGKVLGSTMKIPGFLRGAAAVTTYQITA